VLWERTIMKGTEAVSRALSVRTRVNLDRCSVLPAHSLQVDKVSPSPQVPEVQMIVKVGGLTHITGLDI
jgi:hypothetical protein